jgi:peroxiredoxin Q/BCP
MAQLRQDYTHFVDLNTEVLVLGPNGPRMFQKFWKENEIPFVGLSDVGSKVAETFYQEVVILKLGRMPAVFIIDRKGIIQYVHYGNSMSDIPDNAVVINVLKELYN